MRILTPTLTCALPALALLAFCPGVHAQDASGASASDSSVFSSAASDSDTSGSGGDSSTFSSAKPASSFGSTGSTALLTDAGIGLVGFSLMSLFHGGSSSSSSGTGGLTPNSIPAVPEASSVVSFGLLLTLGLGGLVVTTRKRRSA